MYLLRLLLACLLIVSGSLGAAAGSPDPSASVPQCTAFAVDAVEVDALGEPVGEVDEFARIAVPAPQRIPALRSEKRRHVRHDVPEVFLPAPPEPPAFA